MLRKRAKGHGIPWIEEDFLPPDHWVKTLEKAGCEVKTYKKPANMGFGPEYLHLDVHKDGCIWGFRTRCNQDSPEWEVLWYVSLRTKEDIEAFGSKLAEEHSHIPDEEERWKWLVSAPAYQSLTDVRKDLNDWLWCTYEYRKVRNRILSDLFLKEFILVGGGLKVHTYPSRKRDHYPLADLRYGDTWVDISFQPDDGLYLFSGGPRTSRIEDPSGMLSAIYRRAKKHIKEM